MKGSNSRWYFVVDGDPQMQLELNFKAGSKYQVSVKALVASESNGTNIMPCYRVIGEGVTHFRAGAANYLFFLHGPNW